MPGKANMKSQMLTVKFHTSSSFGIKKADVAEHPEVFDHVGLLVNEPPGTRPGCSLSSHPTVSLERGDP